MTHNDEIKIRVLPRKNEKPEKAQSQTETTGSSARAIPRWTILVGMGSLVLLLAVILIDAPKVRPQKQVQNKSSSSVVIREDDAVTRHLRESHMRREMLTQQRQLENLKLRTTDLEVDPNAVDPTRVYGVQLDQEDITDRVFEDLNGTALKNQEITPDERIKARLVNRKWLNEYEKRERITYVKNFIRSAYEHGYEVELDQNLVVVSVRKVTQPRKVDIDQIIDKLAARPGF